MTETIATIMIAIGLSAACGFRVFLPPLILGILGRAELINLRPELSWLTGLVPITILLVASGFEILAYLIPWVDNLMDALMAPLALIAGTILSASLFEGYDPTYKWALAIVAGGGASSFMFSGTAALRMFSSTSTAGLGNFIIAALETFGAAGFTLLAIAFPIIATLLFALAASVIFYFFKRIRKLSIY